MKRLVCVVEGKGEVRAIPNLVARVIHHVGANGWVVDQEPIRLPRSQLVDERVVSPRRPPREEGLRKATALARARLASAALLLVDADDDCPATFGPPAAKRMRSVVPAAAVMAVREYETWLLWSQPDHALQEHRVRPGAIRDAKRALTKFIVGYAPSTHQLEATRQLDIQRVRARSDSFDKLVRDIAMLVGAAAPARTTAAPSNS